MTSNSRGATLWVLSVTLALTLAAPAAAELSTTEYVELSIARLELARDAWSNEGRSPTEDQVEALCESYGVILDDYHGYAGKNRRQLAGYLEENPELADAIQALSDEIAALIESAEAQE